MLIPVVPTNFRKRPAKAKAAFSAPIILPNQIVSISLRGDALAYIVTVSNPLNGFSYSPDTWFFIVGGAEEIPVSGSLIDPTHVQLVMGFDVSGTTSWDLIDTSGFDFVNGEPLVAPITGLFPFP
jgi:hypothetical protein